MASAIISETIRPAYLWTGTEWVQIGDGGFGSVVGGTNIDVNYNEELNTYTVNTNSDLENIDSISTPNFIEFNTSFSPSASLPTGSLYWHEEHQTLHLSLENEVSLDIGQEEHYPPVINNSGVQINRGELVMVTGVQGDKLVIAKAVTDGTIEFDYIIGVAAHDIPDNSDEAVIIKFGYVNPVDTDAYTVGTTLYPDPAVAGGLTDVKPNAPGYKVPIAIVTKQGTGGKILVRIANPSTLGESDSNVEFNNLENDDLLVYNSASSIWVNNPVQEYLNTASAAAYASASTYTDSSILQNWNEDESGNLLPNIDNVYSLGSSENRVKDLYLGASSLYIQAHSDPSQNMQISMGEGDKLTIDGDELITSSTASSLYATKIELSNIDAPEIFYQSASPTTAEIGDLWVDSDGDLSEALGLSHIHGQYLAASTASATYLSITNASDTYLTITNASSTYATQVDLNNIDLTSTINTASAAAFASASAYTDSEIAGIDLSPYLTASAASATYVSQTEFNQARTEIDESIIVALVL